MTDRLTLVRARDAAMEAALKAGGHIRSEAGRLAPDSIRDKGINELVTHVDEEAQCIILGHLSPLFPDFAALAEEDRSPSAGSDSSAGSGQSAGSGPLAASALPASSEFRWIIDPIDGTTNFAHGVPPYAVSIGLEHQGAIVVGVVYDVAHDELFTAVRGEGATMNGRRIRVSNTGTLADSLVTTGFPYRSFAHSDLYLEILRTFFQATRGVRRPGAASVDLAWVACGRFDGFFETGLSPWDVAAGSLIVEEAGGTVTDYGRDGSPVHDRQMLASNGRVHQQMLEILRPMRDVGA